MVGVLDTHHSLDDIMQNKAPKSNSNNNIVIFHRRLKVSVAEDLVHRCKAKISKYQRASREMLCYNVCRHVQTSFCGYRCLAGVARMLSCA